MSSKTIRRRVAKVVRHMASWHSTPPSIERRLQQLAHQIHPHVLRCKICGAEFISRGNPYANADRAYRHWETQHDWPTTEIGVK